MNGFFPLRNGHGAGRARSPCPMVGMGWRKGRLGRTEPLDLIGSGHRLNQRHDNGFWPIHPYGRRSMFCWDPTDDTCAVFVSG
jgi:hypothetical protein